jgi:hypothetical protein
VLYHSNRRESEKEPVKAWAQREQKPCLKYLVVLQT